MKKTQMSPTKFFIIIIISVITATLLELFLFNKDYFINSQLKYFSSEFQYNSEEDLSKAMKISDINSYVNLIKMKLNTQYYITSNIEIKYTDNDTSKLETTSSHVQYNNNYIYLKKNVKDISLNFDYENIPSNIKSNFINLGEGSTILLEINPANFDFRMPRLTFLSILLFFIIILLSKYAKCFLVKSKLLNPVTLSITLIIIIRIIYHSLFMYYNTNYDAIDYLNILSFYDLRHFLIHEIRLPIYPLFLDTMKYIFGDPIFLYCVVILQSILSIFSSYVLYKSVFIVSKKKAISILCMLLYSLNTGIYGWNNVILTESFSISFTVIYIYFIVEYMFNKKTKFAYYSLILSCILIFLHPTFLIFLAITFLLYIYRFIFERQKNLKNVIFTGIACSLIVLSYATAFYSQHNYFNLSGTIIRQQFWICIDREYYKDTDKELEDNISKIKSMYGKNAIVLYLDSIYNTYPKKIEFVKKCMKDKSLINIQDSFKIMLNEKYTNFNSEHYLRQNPQINNKIFNIITQVLRTPDLIYFITVYMTIILELIIFLYYLLKHKKISLINLGLLTFILAITVSTFIATNAEYMRTSIKVLPFVYFALTYQLSNLIKSFNKDKEFNKNEVL